MKSKSVKELKEELDAMVKQAVEEIAALQNGGQRKFRTATPEKGDKKRGVGITRKDRSESKKRRKIAKASRRINRRK